LGVGPDSLPHDCPGELPPVYRQPLRPGLCPPPIARVKLPKPGKPAWSEMPWPELELVCRACNFGNAKYTPGSWRENVRQSPDLFFDALVRHYVARRRGEVCDQESGLPHMAHLALGALYLLSLDAEGVCDGPR
jgi:hypothetical protein